MSTAWGLAGGVGTLAHRGDGGIAGAGATAGGGAGRGYYTTLMKALAQFPTRNYIPYMEWDIEYTDQFGDWWDGLTADEQEDVRAVIILLRQDGPALGYPHSSGIHGSRYAHMRELRIQHAGRPYRVLYAFDPRRVAILLIGGDKTGDKRWYEHYVPIADRLYNEHLLELREGGEIHHG
jgi:hypothetical protein